MENEIKNGVNMGKNKFKKTKCGLIPEDWECVRLGEVGEIIMGQSPPSYAYNNKRKGLPLIQGGADFNTEKQWTTFITKTSLKNDILLTVRAPVGEITLSNNKFCIGRGVCAIRSKKIIRFIYYYLKGNKYKWNKYIQGSTFSSISSKDIKLFMLPLPPLKEQEKIAEILETWDNVIEKIDKLIETKEEYKKGLMQQLLTGRMRFPGFGKPAKNKNELPENWKRVRLGYVGKVSMCKRVLKKYTKTKGEIPFYKIGTFASKPDSYINRDLYEEFKKKYPFPKKGDILISASGTIGRLVVYKGEDAYFQDSNIVWISNDEKIILNKLLYYVYHNVKWTTENSTISRLYNNNLRKIKFIIPSLSEQEKIAEILENIDKEIELLKKEKETYEIQKKGLMQQLLTGKIRVRIN